MAGQAGNGKIKSEPLPEPKAVPTFMPIDGVAAPIVTDNRAVAFNVVGVCDMAVDVSLEVGSVADFAIGAGSEGIFTGVDGIEDNFATGVFTVLASGLTGTTLYHWRLTVINGGDTIYYPSATTTDTAQTTIGPGSPPAVSGPTMNVQDKPTNTDQGYFLGISWMDDSGATSFPLSKIDTAGSAWIAWSSWVYRDTSTLDYFNPSGTTDSYVGAFGMWDDGTGMAYWYNDTTDTPYFDDYAPTVFEKTNKYSGPPTTSWDMYNGQNYRTFTSDLTPGWMASDLALDMKSYINTNYGEDLENVDILIKMYDSIADTFTTCYYVVGPGWLNSFALAEGICYIISILNNKLDYDPVAYDLPNTEITSPVTIDIYNGKNLRGVPVSLLSTASELVIDIKTYINTTYGESLADTDIELVRYNSSTGQYVTCWYSPDFDVWLNDFDLARSWGYWINIRDGALSSEPRAYTPSFGKGAGGSDEVSSKPEPEPKAVPVLMMNPLSVNVNDVGFAVAGVVHKTSDAEVEVGTASDFVIGTGDIGVFSGTDGIEDAFSTGAFLIHCVGLDSAQTYHYRVKIMDNSSPGDFMYYPDAAATVSVTTAPPDSPPGSNPNVAYQAQDLHTHTIQPYFLYLSWVEDAAQLSHPLALIDYEGIGAVGFTGNNFRDSSTGLYIQTGPGFTWHANTMGMWDDGYGFMFWWNSLPDYPNSGFLEADPPSPASILYTTAGGHYDSTATGPEGSSSSLGPFAITYNLGCGCQGITELYYSDDYNATWNYIDADPDDDGSYLWIAPGPGVYWWIANGDSWIGPPGAGQPAEAGPYIITIPETWNLHNGQNYRTFSSDLTPGWMASDLAEDIVAYINANYAEDLVNEDISITRYDSFAGSFKKCYYVVGPGWLNNFALAEGDGYIVSIQNGKLDSQPLAYELPNSAITNPVAVDLYNGRNYRGFPVTTNVMASDLAEDIVAYINANYGEDLENIDIEISMYDSFAGSFKKCYYVVGPGWLNNFTLNPEGGYIISILNNKLDSQPLTYVPS